MNYLVKGLLVSTGWHLGKLMYEMVEEITFNRLHQNNTYAAICKQTPDGPRLIVSNSQINENQTIGFKVD